VQDPCGSRRVSRRVVHLGQHPFGSGFSLVGCVRETGWAEGHNERVSECKGSMSVPLETTSRVSMLDKTGGCSWAFVCLVHRIFSGRSGKFYSSSRGHWSRMIRSVSAPCWCNPSSSGRFLHRCHKCLLERRTPRLHGSSYDISCIGGVLF
jgi:hypothetical protein